MCILITTKWRTGVHRLDNIMNVQLYNWSKQSVWSTSINIRINGPSKVYTDPIGMEHGAVAFGVSEKENNSIFFSFFISAYISAFWNRSENVLHAVYIWIWILIRNRSMCILSYKGKPQSHIFWNTLYFKTPVSISNSQE